MNKTISNFILIIFFSLIVINCANRGAPDGGPQDITPPKILSSKPANYATNFTGDEIKIRFDEYIKIKDIQKQLIISPPMKTQPRISPLGGASKEITIKIYDTLQPNITYAFNFGNSITDNNESNPYPYYRYVFSTGSYIDSISVKGNITDALNKQPETFVNVALYEVDSTFTDSIVYKETPKYITNTLDSATTFSINNIKEGKYMLMAIKDKNGDNKFQQKTDQIAFYKSFINVPNDSLYSLKLFYEALDFKAMRPKLIAENKIRFGYEGGFKNMKIDILSNVPSSFKYRITKEKEKDTLYYWYRPKLEVDSLIFKVSNIDFEKEFTVRLTKQETDSLTISTYPLSSISEDEPFKITGATPFVSIDSSKIILIDKDSTAVNFTTKFDTLSNTYNLNFKKTKENKYKIQILPDALTDFFDNKNDTLNYSLSMKKESDYGYARFNLVNAKYPLIIQLTDDKGEVKEEQYSTKPEVIDFLSLSPGKYFVRVIHDINGNKKYDTGNYLKKIQPEPVSHFLMTDDVRANWGLIETLKFTEK